MYYVVLGNVIKVVDGERDMDNSFRPYIFTTFENSIDYLKRKLEYCKNTPIKYILTERNIDQLRKNINRKFLKLCVKEAPKGFFSPCVSYEYYIVINRINCLDPPLHSLNPPPPEEGIELKKI